MKKNSIEYNGVFYPTIDIELNKVSDVESDEFVTLADASLWDAIEKDYYNDVSEAEDIDNDVYFYCEHGFIESVENEWEVVDYMAKYC